MGTSRDGRILRALWTRARGVAFAILAGLWRRRPPEELEARLLALPAREQAAIVAAVLGALFLTSLLFAHQGVVGMLLFLLLVIVVVN